MGFSSPFLIEAALSEAMSRRVEPPARSNLGTKKEKARRMPGLSLSNVP